MKFKFKNIVLVSMLGIAGLFGVVSVALNKSSSLKSIEKAEADANTEVARIYIDFTGWDSISNVHFNTSQSGTYQAARQASTTASYASHTYSTSSSYWVCEVYPAENGSTLYSYFTQYGNNQYKATSKTGNAAKSDTTQSLGVTVQRGYVYYFVCNYVTENSWADKRFGVKQNQGSGDSTWTNVGYFARFAYDNGTRSGSDSYDAIEVKKNTSFSLLHTPSRSGWTFLGWKSSADSALHPAQQSQSSLSAPITFTAAWCRTTEGSGYIRLWFYPCDHYQEGTKFEWKLWDGVGGTSAVSAVEWVETNSGSGKYIAYFDLATSWVNKKIVFQIFENGNWIAQTKENDFTLSPGDNAYILYPFYENSAWHIGKGTAAKCASHDKDNNLQVDYNVLERVFLSYQTCNSDKSKGYGNADVLANTWVWDSSSATSSKPNIKGTTSKATAEAYLNNYTIFDYSGTGTSSYSSVTNKTRGVTLYEKYYAMLNMQTKGTVSAMYGISPLGLLGGTSDNFSTIIIVISSSVALLSVTALSILVIRKRKSKEQ